MLSSVGDFFIMKRFFTLFALLMFAAFATSCKWIADTPQTYTNVVRIVNTSDSTVSLTDIRCAAFPYPESIELSPGDEWTDSFEATIIGPYGLVNIAPDSLFLNVGASSIFQDREEPRHTNRITYILYYDFEVLGEHAAGYTYIISNELLSELFGKTNDNNIAGV